MTALASSPIRRRSWGIRSALPRRAATAALWGQSERWRKSAMPRSPKHWTRIRAEEKTSEIQSLMRSSYAVFCLKKKNKIAVNAKKERRKLNAKIERKHYITYHQNR